APFPPLPPGARGKDACGPPLEQFARGRSDGRPACRWGPNDRRGARRYDPVPTVLTDPPTTGNEKQTELAVTGLAPEGIQHRFRVRPPQPLRLVHGPPPYDPLDLGCPDQPWIPPLRCVSPVPQPRASLAARRGCIRRLPGFGLRFRARGSQRPGRPPTRWYA